MNKLSINPEVIESALLELPQVDCPVAHHFGPGIYIREVTLPAGIYATGHAQKFEHLNILLKGKVAILSDGEVKVLEAPLIFTGQPGRKVGYIIETCVWQNVYATSETDIDKLEAHFIDKSQTWLDHNATVTLAKKLEHEVDREDFEKMLEDTGFDSETVRSQSEDESDQIQMPTQYLSIVSVRESNIEGKGIFLSWHVHSGMIIAPGRIKGKRTPVGRYVNHSKNPNCKYVLLEDGDIYLVAIKDIKGCVGGGMGDELTVDYRQAIEVNKRGGELCQA